MQAILLLVAVQSAAPGPVEQALQLRILPQLDSCSRPAAGDEIVVCARRGGDDPYRIPEPLRDQAEPGGRISGAGPASLDSEPFAPCGIFQGQRKCSKADAAHFGYGNGRDPITVAGKVIAEIANPD